MTLKTKKIIVIVGTTASGKSDLAISLAQKYNGEVISADSRQVYTGLDIATGKVTKDEMQGIPHHLMDIIDPKEVYTASDFARDGQRVLTDIFSRNMVPIIAGGTGFYIDALITPSILSGVPPNKDLRHILEQKTAEELFKQLQTIDARRASDIENKGEQHLVRRLVRAIEVASSPASDKSHGPDELLEVLWIGITWDKDVLNERIHQRTLSRMNTGMITEAETLHKEGLSWDRMETLGLEYKHLADYLRDRISKEELVEFIERGDRQYAKRQRTWFKRNENIHWLESTELEKAEGLVEEFLKS